MANLRRTDSSQNPQVEAQGQLPSQIPIVLARLPRVGAAAPLRAPAATATFAPPAPAPESLPQLELRNQISERIKLHVAEPPNNPSNTPGSHFADRQHGMQAEPVIRRPAPTASTDRTHSPSRSSSIQRTSSQRSTSSQRPASLSDKLYQLHGSLSPHAGLIVAFALIASAALLYWMIVGPSQAPGPLYQDYGTQDYGNELQHDGFGATSQQQLPADYLPQFTAELPQSSSPATDQWNQIELTQPEQPAVKPTQLPQPTLEPARLSTSAATDPSPYPKTRFPEPLAFDQATQTPMSPANQDVARGLPEVANRSIDSTTR